MAKKKKTFEESLKRLEDIIETMEDSETDLNKTVELYKEGVELSAFCMDTLSDTEKTVSVLAKNMEGKFRLDKFTEE